jgi:hypothetical protein
VFPASPGGPVRISWARNAEMPLFERFRRRSSLGAGVVITICFALRLRYLAGEDSTGTPYAGASLHLQRFAIGLDTL